MLGVPLCWSLRSRLSDHAPWYSTLLTSLRTACALSPCSVQDAQLEQAAVALCGPPGRTAAHTHTRDHVLTTTHMFIESHHFFGHEKVTASRAHRGSTPHPGAAAAAHPHRAHSDSDTPAARAAPPSRPRLPRPVVPVDLWRARTRVPCTRRTRVPQVVFY